MSEIALALFYFCFEPFPSPVAPLVKGNLFHKEPGWRKVRDTLHGLLAQGEKAQLCLINWGEFYYVVKRRVGQEKAEEALALVQQLPIALVSVDDRLVKEAATLKSEHPISYADAFCIATALRSSGQILTRDSCLSHPLLNPLPSREGKKSRASRHSLAL